MQFYSYSHILLKFAKALIYDNVSHFDNVSVAHISDNY